MKYYYQQGFTYIELGDGDELWENRNINRIVDIYNNIFQLLSRFYQEERLYFVYGKSPYYMNCGNCIHPGCITGIEITGNRLSLVKWLVDTKKDRSLYVTKEILSSVNY